MSASGESRRDFLVRVGALAVAAPAALAGPDGAQEAGPDSAGGARARRVREGIQGIRRDYERHREAIDDLVRVHVELAPELLRPGEEVALTIRAHSAKPPNAALEVIRGAYDASPERREEELLWKREAPDVYTAAWRWRPPGPGSYQVRWTCDVGGDVPEFRRGFSVIDDSWLVVILNSTSHREPRPEPDFHALGLPFSYWAELLLFGGRASAEAFAGPSRLARRYGDDPGLMVFMGGDYLPDDKTVFYDEPEEVQRAVLGGYREIWPMHRFPRPLRSLYTYGMGNGPARVARSLGYDLLGALCADQNWGDGPFKINHWGMPARPYFVSREDFRKPGSGGSGAMVGVQQCERQTVECRDYDCVYSFEGAIAYALDQYSGVTRRRMVDDALIAREAAFFECFAQAAGQTGAPLMVSCGIEFNGVWPDMAAVNRHFLQYLSRRARSEKVAFVSATAAADYLHRHARRTPESAVYMPDVYAGIVSGGKPAAISDTMEIENDRLKAIFRRGEALPYAQYDYTATWRYSDWGNEDIPRDARGYVIPGTDDRFRVTPRIVDTRPFTVTSHLEEGTDATRVLIDVEAKKPRRALALAVWDIPRAHTRDPARVRVAGATRFLPVRAAFTGNLCGIVVADIRQGTNRIELTVRGPARPPRSQDLRLGERVMAKVFELPGGAMAYVYLTGGAPEKVEFRPEPGAGGLLYAPDSDEPRPLGKPVTIDVSPGACWRIGGLDREALRRACPAARPA